MTYDNLCTATDVSSEGQFTDDLDTQIEYRIPGATIEVYRDSEQTTTPTDETILYYMKMACIYNVLSWLERKGLIESLTSNVTSYKDGDFNVTFKAGENKDEPQTYEEYYSSYIAQIKPSMPVGARARRWHH